MNYVVIEITFADSEVAATYKELIPNRDHTKLQVALKDFDAVGRDFFEMSEFTMASLIVPATADIAAGVSYVGIETALLPHAASPNWVPALNSNLDPIQIAAIISYADMAITWDADLAAHGPCKLVCYDINDDPIAPGDGAASVWYIVLKR